MNEYEIDGCKFNKNISLHFHPVVQKSGNMVVEKTDKGVKRYYIEGISSGLKEDAHKEMMSEKCVKGFVEQANSGDILLFPGVHGIDYSNDMGILENCDITKENDWYTSYRLYDSYDNVGQEKVQRNQNILKQMWGVAPYKKPKTMGFSIEGILNENSVIKDYRTGKVILDEISLDGVLLTPRPAYRDSIANGVYKALNILPSWTVDKVKKSLQGKLSEIIQEKELQNQYWNKRFDINAALEESIEEIMKDPQAMKQERLSLILDEYKTVMIQLILGSQALFSQENDLNQLVSRSINKQGIDKILKSLNAEMAKLQVLKNIGGK